MRYAGNWLNSKVDQLFYQLLIRSHHSFDAARTSLLAQLTTFAGVDADAISSGAT